MTFFQKRRVILTYGRFDQFSAQHAIFLQQASALGNELIIGCATDGFATSQGLPCQTDLEQRREILEHCRFVDRVIPLQDADQIRTDIVNYNVSVLVMGHQDQGAFENLQDVAQVHYLPRPFSMQIRDIAANCVHYG